MTADIDAFNDKALNDEIPDKVEKIQSDYSAPGLR